MLKCALPDCVALRFPSVGMFSLPLCFLILGFSLFLAFRRLIVKHEAKTGLSVESTAEML